MFHTDENEQQVESQVQTDVASESSPAQPEQQSTQPNEQEASTAAKEVPLHEHPRFKEVIEQKNQFATEAKQLRDAYAAMEARLKAFEEQSKPKPAENPLHKRLKEIDPEFGSAFEQLAASQAELNELKQWKQQQAEERFVSQAVSQIDQLHAKNAVSDEVKALYNERLDTLYRMGKLRSMEDVQNAYNSVHENYSRVLEGVRRKERESYLATKTAAAAKPATQPKGAPARASNGQFSSDPAAARQQMVQSILKQSKASKDV